MVEHRFNCVFYYDMHRAVACDIFGEKSIAQNLSSVAIGTTFAEMGANRKVTFSCED